VRWGEGVVDREKRREESGRGTAAEQQISNF
jgi:hypothetical protein